MLVLVVEFTRVVLKMVVLATFLFSSVAVLWLLQNIWS